MLRVMGSYLCLIVLRVLKIERADRAEISADDPTQNKKTYRSQVTGCSSIQSCILYTHRNNWIKRSKASSPNQTGVDKTINKYFLSVCGEELWSANRSDFTDS